MKTTKLVTIVLSVLISGMVSAQSYSVNAEKSTLVWLGKKVTGEHTGNIKIKEGSFDVKKDKIVSGTFLIDMTTITNTDLTDASYNAKWHSPFNSVSFVTT